MLGWAVKGKSFLCETRGMKEVSLALTSSGSNFRDIVL